MFLEVSNDILLEIEVPLPIHILGGWRLYPEYIMWKNTAWVLCLGGYRNLYCVIYFTIQFLALYPGILQILKVKNRISPCKYLGTLKNQKNFHVGTVHGGAGGTVACKIRYILYQMSMASSYNLFNNSGLP
jgi:hypothetical protein